MVSSADTLGLTSRRRRTVTWTGILVCALLGAFTMGLLLGPTDLSFSQLMAVFRARIVGQTPPAEVAMVDTIVWGIRTPRLLLGVAVGAGLAVAGAILQAVVRNLLADPYTLGINSGASTGAAAMILFGVGVGGAGRSAGTTATGASDLSLQASAFVGALAAALLMFFIARSAGRLTSVRLLMAGIAVGYALSALTSFLVFASDSAEGARSVMFWLLGSLALGQWNAVLGVTFAVVAVIGVLLWWLGPQVDALTIGDDTALTLGINPDRLRLLLVVLTCVLVAAVVAMAGSIGFVGLIIPHAGRRLVGGTHRHLLPVTALLGAILLVTADIASRLLLAPQEIPIGILTSLVGAPFLLILVHRMVAHP